MNNDRTKSNIQIKKRKNNTQYLKNKQQNRIQKTTY